MSHGSLLIRSPRDSDHPKNVDLICTGVEYLAVARHLKGIELVEPTAEEIAILTETLETRFSQTAFELSSPNAVDFRSSQRASHSPRTRPTFSIVLLLTKPEVPESHHERSRKFTL